MLHQFKNIFNTLGHLFNNKNKAPNIDEDPSLNDIYTSKYMIINKPNGFFNVDDIWNGSGKGNPGLRDFIENNSRILRFVTDNNADDHDIEECYLLEMPQYLLREDKIWRDSNPVVSLLDGLKEQLKYDFGDEYNLWFRFGIQGAQNLPSRNHVRFSTGSAVYAPYPNEEKKWRVLVQLRYLDKNSNKYKCEQEYFIDIFDEQRCIIGCDGIGLNLKLYNKWFFRKNDKIILLRDSNEGRSHSVRISSDNSDRFGPLPRWSKEHQCYAIYYTNNKQKILTIKVVQIKDLHDTAIDPEKEKTDDIFNQLFSQENIDNANYPASPQPLNEMRKKFDSPDNQGTILADTVTNNIRLHAFALQRPSHFYTHPIKGFNIAFNTDGYLAAIDNTDEKLIFCVNRSDQVTILDQADNVSPLWCEYADLIKNNEIKSKYKLEFCQFNDADQLKNYLGYVLLSPGFSKMLPINKGEVLELGRNGDKSKVIRPLSYCEFELLDGNKMNLDRLGLSREHMTVRADDKGLYIRLQNGKQAFHLDEHLNFVSTIPPDQEYLLADKQHILVANYIWQYQTKF